jgi:hypothetical protein
MQEHKMQIFGNKGQANYLQRRELNQFKKAENCAMRNS